MIEEQSDPVGVSDTVLSDRIAAAEDRCFRRLVEIDVRSCGISEYSQGYLEDKIRNAKSILALYGRLLYLAISRIGVPLDRFVLVDYGGGVGVLSFLANELGIGTVIYNDIYDVSCFDVKLLSKVFGLQMDNIVCGDVDQLATYLRLNSISANAIVSYDVLEHVYDVKSHFRTLGSLSDGQLRVVYASGANIENPWYVHTATRSQIEAELSDRPKKWGHKERDSLRAYKRIRMEMISSYAPDLSVDQVEQLSVATRGLMKPEIEKCVDEYRTWGQIAYRPDHPTNTCDPYTGNWCEHLMSTQWLKEVLEDAGFSVEILTGQYALCGSVPKIVVKMLLNGAIRLIGKRGMVLAPYYVVRADHLVERKYALGNRSRQPRFAWGRLLGRE